MSQIKESEIKKETLNSLTIEIVANQVRSTTYINTSYPTKLLIPTYVSAGNYQVSPDGSSSWETITVGINEPIAIGMLQPYFRVTENATVTFFTI
jgi:hypothetical protein